jgi:23S rRNA (uracil1939-C5)-methyltransferase
MKKKHPRLAEININSFSKDGHGIGAWERPDGQIVQVKVPFSIPGDRLVADVIKRQRIFQGYPIEWLEQSPLRISPKCIHFNSCGGCQWQQIPYEEQLKQKEEWVRNCLASTLTENTVRHPIITCEPSWNYRNKMEFSFSSDKEGNRYLGLFLFSSRGRVFNLEECHLCNPWMSQAVKITADWWSQSGLEAYHPRKDTGSLRTLILREGMRTGDRLVMLTVSGNPLYSLKKGQIDLLVAALKEGIQPLHIDQKLSIFLRIQQTAKGKQTQFYEILLDGPDHLREILHLSPQDAQKYSLEFGISPSAFFQPNTRQSEQLYSAAIRLMQIPQDAIIYDLYCGTGTLGICIARFAKKVIGIELSPESVCDARENIKRNALSNITIHQGDVGVILQTLLEEKKELPDIVIVDPPRAGLEAKALTQILALKTPILIYISCNPATQGVNLESLIKEGYSLKAIQPVDQFPQTVHVENIALLTR